MSSITAVDRFLQAVFPDYVNYAIFANLNPAYHTRIITELDGRRDCYWSIAAFDPGHTERTLARALEVRALVIDDVGTKVPTMAVEMALGTPTAIVETSLGNFQWVYRLSTPVAVTSWNGFFAGIEKRVGYPLEGRDAVHIFRLPMGVNTKPSRGGFEPRRVELNSGIELSVGKYLGFPTVPAAISGGADVKLNHSQLEALMGLIPNDLDRDAWVDVGHGLKALCLDDEDGFEVFDAWSQLHDSYDAGKTRVAWDSFGASGLRSKGGRLRARAEGLDPAGFKTWEADAVFDDGEDPIEGTAGPKPAGITAAAYQWIEPDKLPYRDWLYGKILIRRFISMTVAPGGVGKSSLIATETLAQVTGQPLLGEKQAGCLRVWLWNLEDPYEETQRKIQAAALHYGISKEDLGDRLFVDSGREQKLVVAQMDRNGGPMIVRPVITALVEQIRLHKIDIVVVDPFVSCHEVPENDNTAQDMVVKEWGRVAELGNCAVHLIDHTRKAPIGTEVTTESSRGGKAKTDAARVVRVINRLTDAQSKLWGVMAPWRYFSSFNDKANMAPPIDRQDWFYLESVDLGNGTTAGTAFAGVNAEVVPGDSVGVVRRWEPPKPSDIAKGNNFTQMAIEMGNAEWRADYQAGDRWIGVPAAKACGLLRHSLKDRKQIREAISIWLDAGLIKEVSQMDENRKERKFIKLVGGF